MSVHAPGLELDYVAIPGAEGDLGCGDAQRSRFVPGSDFTGAHADNPAHFSRQGPGTHGWQRGELELRSVCWLAVGATVPRVPAGEWEGVLHVQASNTEWVADWRLGVGVGHQRGFPDGELDAQWDGACEEALRATGVAPRMFRSSGLAEAPSNAGNELLQAHVGRPVLLSFGRLRLKETADVRFEMGGGAPFWCSGIVFGGLELRAVGMPWEQLRLLLLCREGRAGPDAWLQRLPPEIIEQIVRMLHTPLGTV